MLILKLVIVIIHMKHNLFGTALPMLLICLELSVMSQSLMCVVRGCRVI